MLDLKTRATALLFALALGVTAYAQAPQMMDDRTWEIGSHYLARNRTVWIDNPSSSNVPKQGAKAILSDLVFHDTDEASTSTTTITDQPNWPTNLVYCVTNNDTTNTPTVTIKVTGKNQFGQVVSESVTLDNDDDLSGDTTGQIGTTGNVAFATVTTVVATFTSGTTATSDSLDIGLGGKLGIPMRLGDTTDVWKVLFDGADETLGTINKQYNTYVPTGVLDGSSDLVLFVRSSIKDGRENFSQ